MTDQPADPDRPDQPADDRPADAQPADGDRPAAPADAQPVDDRPAGADRPDSPPPSHIPEAPVTSPGLPPSLAGPGGRRTVLRGSQAGHSVIQQIEERIGQPSRVLLRDEDSAHGASPVLAGQGEGGATSAVPAGRGQYQVMGEIARGGMGVVLKGHDTDLGRDVAMKVLLEEHAGSDSILQRFVEEAQVGGQLQHPGIVPVYELGLLEDERPYFTMKLVKGRTLAALLGERKDLRTGRRRFLGIFEQVCQTIAYAHARKVIHRDLKPANIMVGAFGEVQVVDWGLSKVLREGGVADERPDRTRPPTQVSIIETVRSGSGSVPGSHSLVGSVMGTPGYMSPEQAQGEIERLDERTDVFALGAILAEILTGRPPYVGEHDKVIVEAARALQDGLRQALEGCQAEPELVELALRCLSANRQLRPAHAGALAEEVQEFLASSEERARQAELSAAQATVRAEQERKRRRQTLSLAAVVLLAVVAGGWGWLELRDQRASQLAATERRQAEVAAKVAGVLGDVQLLRGQERWEEALVALDQADTILAASSDVPAELTTRVAGVRGEVQAAASAEQAALDEQARLETLLATLEELQFGTDGNPWNRSSQRDQADEFERAFAAFGVAVLDGDPLDVATRLRDTGHAEALGMALDSWARAVLAGAGFEDPAFVSLIELARNLDPDPERLQLRRALLRDDRAAFERLAASPEARLWPPQTVVTFAQSVRALGHRIDLAPLLRACQVRHPDNPGVAMLLGWELAYEAGHDPDEALVYLSVARALDPDNRRAMNSMVWVHVARGRLGEAADLMIDYLSSDPTNESASDFLMPRMTEGLIARGRYDLAVDVFRRAARIAPEAISVHNNLAWFLCVHPDPSERNPQEALAAARRALEIEQGLPGGVEANTYNTLGMALYRAGEYAAAVDALRRSMELGAGGNPVDWLVVAMSLEQLGLHDQALPWYERGRNASMGSVTEENWFLDEDMAPYDDLSLLKAEARALILGG